MQGIKNTANFNSRLRSESPNRPTPWRRFRRLVAFEVVGGRVEVLVQSMLATKRTGRNHRTRMLERGLGN
jgi:hypothetical protein